VDTAKGYVTAEDSSVYRYPFAGDDKPPRGAKVVLLTRGGVAVLGPWSDSGNFLGWAPLPKRDKNKEREKAVI
jgi:hypothetical protein